MLINMPLANKYLSSTYYVSASFRPKHIVVNKIDKTSAPTEFTSFPVILTKHQQIPLLLLF